MIVIADLHGGKTNDSIIVDGVPSQTSDLRKRLSGITARAKMLNTCIAVAGDVFNRVNPTTQSMSMFFEWLRDCYAHHVPVYIIAGNHDAGVDWSSMTMMYNASLPNVTVVTQPDVVMVSDGGGTFPVLFFPHVPTTVQERAEQGHGSVSRWVASQFPDAEMVITHGMIDSSDYSNDIFFEAGNAMRIEPEEFKNLKLMVLGHIHGHLKGKNWVYPGSLTINNFGEVDELKGWVEVNLSTHEYVWHEFPDDVTPWVHIELDLTDKDETSLEEDTLRSIVDGAIVKVTVFAKAHGIINESYIRQLIMQCGGHVSRFETKVTQAVTGKSTEASKVSHEQLLVEYLDSGDVDRKDKKRAIALARDIIAEVLG